MAIILLLVFAGFVQAAGDAQFNAQAKQVNDALRQLRQACKGDPGCIQYSNQADKLWKQTQDLWAMQQRYQQQNGLNQMQTQLLAEQQNLKNQLIKQQQFLQQQPAASKTPELKTINPFGDYGQYGVSLHSEDGRLHGPGTIADTPEGSGMGAWKEATRQLESIFPKTPASPSQTASNKGSYDIPLADNATVRILGSGALGNEGEYKAFLEQTEGNKYAKMSPDELRNVSEKYPNNFEIQKATNVLLASQKAYKNLSDLNEDAVINEDRMNSKMGEGNKAAVHTGALAIEVVSPVPAAVTESFVARDGEGLKKAVVDSIKDEAKNRIFPGKDIYDKMDDVLNKIPQSTIDALNHYDSASEPYGYIRATGGLEPSFTKAAKAYQDMLSRSQKLHNLIEEQNRKKSALTSDKPEPKADSPPTQQSITPTELELGRREIPKTEPKADSGWREIPMDPKWINNE